MLTGELVRLRPFEPEDADTVKRWQDDEEVMRWTVMMYPESLHGIRKRFAARGPVRYESAYFAIETRDNGRFIGWTGLGQADPINARAQLDLAIGEKEFWGRGIGTEVTKLLCRYGFETMRLHSIELKVWAEHDAAKRLYENIGFREVGRQREVVFARGEWHDHIVMDLLHHELEA